MIYIPAVFVFGCPSSQWAYTALIPFRQYKRNPDQLIESQADFTISIGAHWVGRSCARGCTGGSNGENATASSSALSLSVPSGGAWQMKDLRSSSKAVHGQSWVVQAGRPTGPANAPAKASKRLYVYKGNRNVWNQRGRLLLTCKRSWELQTQSLLRCTAT